MKTGSLAASVTERGAAGRALVAGTLIFGAIAILLAILAFALASPSQAQAQSNEIVEENALEGDPKSEWDVQGAGDPNIQGFATDISVDQGQTVDFKVDTEATNYKLDIYRMGYYGGDGARKVTTIEPSAQLPQNQPECLNDSSTGLIDCGNWGVSASWQVPTDAVSGIYFAKLVREDVQSGGSHILFIVRDDDGNSDLLFQTSDTTWQAYNTYGGNSLYQGSTSFPAGRASKVSYNRPFNTRAANNGEGEDWLFNSEYPMVRWLERNGYDVSYFTDVDSDRRGDEILEHDAFLSVGHDEYWSKGQRDKVEAARNAGVDLAFFSGNEVYWKTRWENSVDGSNTPYRTLVTYKEGDRGELTCGGKCDPNNNVWTGLWRTGGAPYDAGQPENALTGQISWVGTTSNIEVPAADGKLRFWRNTSIKDLQEGQEKSLPPGTLGYEWDFEQKEYEGSNPGGRITMSETTRDGKTHKLSLYRDDNGSGQDALVFGAGTVQWSWGLDDDHDRGGFGGPNPPPDQDMQQATVNLFADMGVQPATLQSGLTSAQASTDTTAPTSQITSPAAGATVEEDRPVTITGTASDGDAGGVVGAVEVSVDGGQTWHPATGRDEWLYTWTPQAQGSATIQSRAADDSGNLGTASPGVTVTVGPQAPATCPCSIWDETATPTNPNENDSQAVELGVKFRSDTDGYITGVRFYKGSQNTGPHVGHLWTIGRQQLAEATFAGETASGWQEVRFDNPVQITKDTTYVASYHTTVGFYSEDENYFASGVDNPPLHALANGDADGPNGVYAYGPSGSFPDQTFQSSNYYVDVVFESSVGPDTTPPTVRSVSPTDGQSGVNTSANVTATFNEAMDAATMQNNIELRDASNNLVPASVDYSATSRTAILDPNAALENSKTYTATIKGGSNGVKDTAGNALAEDRTWTFTTAAPPAPPPDEGPGGPIAVIGSADNPFGRYYAEILRNEGLNAFTATDISSVSAGTLDQYDTVVLGDMPLTDAQVATFTDWVNGGGNLIVMSPDPKLAGLLGLTSASGALSDAYLKADTASAPGKGIVGETMQFHGAADRYSLNGATAVATLYSDANTATQNPAVTLRDVGTNGGQAAAFTYDLAKSVVYTRQGNPAWAGQERDGEAGLRPDDMFYPDWVNLDKVAIPQADEQQRLLANLIGQMNLDKKPLPRFWYFPRGEEAVVVMTGDDHGNGGTAGQFDWFESQSPAGCSVEDWECVRGTSYIYTSTPLSPAQAKVYENKGHEVALHVETGCQNPWAAQNLPNFYTDQLTAWKAKYTTLNTPATNRTHCLAWSDWATQPKVEFDNGIRFDTNYYYWPGNWIQNRPGVFTGSGMPMRFADTDGKMIDVYQATTQLTDESGQNIPVHIKALLDKALGPEGYYGAFTANMHTDHSDHAEAKAIVNEAKPRGVPVVTARQMLEWLDGRNASSFGNMSWNQNKLNFSVNVGTGANGLQAMVPARSDTGKLTGITRGGNQVTFTNKTIKGVEYAVFAANAGAYEATYEADTGAPVISALNAAPAADGTATITWSTDEASTSRVDYGTSPDALNLNAPPEPGGLTTSHSVGLTGLEANTTYHYRVTSEDADGNAATSPQGANPPASFDTPEAGLTDTTTADFSDGTPGAGTHVTQTGDGEVILKPTVAEEFTGTSLPAGWESVPWPSGGNATVANDKLTIDGTRANPQTLYGPGRSLEFVATFGSAEFQHAGFGQNLESESGEAWAMFSTWNTTGTLYARTNNDGATANVEIPNSGNFIGSQHRYRIEWAGNEVRFFVDDNLVHTQTVAIGAQMRPLASDFNNGGATIVVDWLRMGPYASSGQFASRALDSTNTATDWGKLTSAVQKPTGTNVTFETRSGNTATPDGTWSAWQAVGSNDTIASPNNRYIQYRANLSTPDAAITPSVEQVTLTYGEGAPDNEAPVITELNAAPGADGTATITWSTDEASTSRVDYGTSPDALNLNAPPEPGGLTTSHSVGLTGLEAGTTYYYRVSSADGTGNAATSPAEGQDPASFETLSAPPAGFTDTTTSDFSAGTTPGASTYVSQTDNGEVILNPTVGAEFSGSGLPSGWFSSPWVISGNTSGNAAVLGGALNVDGACAGTGTSAGANNCQATGGLYGPGRSLEFVGTFTGARFQHVGFGVDYNNNPNFAMFSTKGGGGLYARTNPGGSETQLSSDLLNAPHRYRVEWKASEVVFYVDGSEVARHSVGIANSMRPLASDLNAGDGAVSIDWLRMDPYTSSGAFESRVFDSEKIASDWLKLTQAAQKPAGTIVAFETRSGNTATPDATWSAWQAIGADDTIASPDNRYIQYRANLTTNDQSVTPRVEQVTLTYGEGAPDTTPPVISELEAAPGADGTATIIWSTDEASDSRVDYGTSPGALNDSVSVPTPTNAHSVGLTGLEAGTTYYYRVSSADGAGNATTSPAEDQDPASFQTPDAGFTDNTAADFGAGTLGTNSYVAQSADGEVTLKPTVGEEFSGTDLPTGWSQTQTWSSGGSNTVANGQLTVDAAQIQTNDSYGSGRTIEFAATFGARDFQTVGFATDLSTPQNSWAQFGTASSTSSLSARTNDNAGQVHDFAIPNSSALLGTKHLYRIEWAANEVRFFVDDNLVHTQTVAIGAQMRPVVSDFRSGGPDLSVDWLRMDPYQSPGAFESRVFDSTKTATDWRELTSAAQKPAGTDVTFETRSGNTETPDGTWSAWQAVGAGDEIASPHNRYIQYRANLSTNDQSVTPRVEQVTLSYGLDKSPPTAPSKPDLAAESDTGDSHSDNVTNNNTPNLTGTAEGNSSVELFADGTSLGTTDADATGAWSFTPAVALADGTYQVTAKATDGAGNPSPASEALSLEIDTAAPDDTSITAGPQDTTTSTSAEFAFSSAEQGVSFQCKLDGGDYEPCESPKTYTGLGDGQHTFSVRAVDTAGNTDASPAVRGFNVDGTGPNAPTITSPQNNTYDNDGDFEVSGTAEAGSTVELFEGDSSVGTDEADPDTGAWSIQLNGVPNGEHTYTAKATDGAGNVSEASAEVKVTVDTVAPSASLTAPDDGARARGTVNLSADANDNTGVERVEFLVDGNVVGSAASAPYTFAWDTTGVPEGDKAITARAHDLAGNTTTSDARTVAIDNTAPAAPLRPDLATASDSGFDTADNVTNDDTPTFEGTAEAGDTVEILIDGVVQGSTTATGGNYSVTVSTLGDGPHNVTARVTDATGNQGAESEALSVTIDTQSPGPPSKVDLIAASDSGSDNTDNVTNDTTPTFDVTAEADSTVRIYRDSDATPLGSAKANSSGATTVTSEQLAHGTYSILATAEDAAGNVSDSSATIDVTVETTVDTQPPEVTLITPAENAIHVPVETDVTATFSEEMDQASVEGNFELAEQGGAAVAATVSYDSFTKKATLTPGADLKAGTSYTVTLTTDVKDRAGNPLASAKSWSFTTSEPADTTAPTVTIDPEGVPAAITNNANPSFSFSSNEAGSTFECSLSSGMNPDAFAPCSSGQNYGPLANGTYTFKVKATDAAGNTGEAASYSFRVDTTKPAAPSRPDLLAASDTGTSSTDNITRETVPRFRGQAEAGSEVSVYDGSQLLGKVNATNAGTWNFQVTTPLSQGVHSIRSRATDAAGNVSAASTSLSITIDTTSPTITNRTPASGASTTDRTPTISATVKDDPATLTKSNITFFLDGAKVTTFSYATNLKKFSYTPNKNLSLRTHTVELRVEDKAGNQAANGSWSFRVR